MQFVRRLVARSLSGLNLSSTTAVTGVLSRRLAPAAVCLAVALLGFFVITLKAVVVNVALQSIRVTSAAA
jgi:hypothetical protein